MVKHIFNSLSKTLNSIVFSEALDLLKRLLFCTFHSCVYNQRNCGSWKGRVGFSLFCGVPCSLSSRNLSLLCDQLFGWEVGEQKEDREDVIYAWCYWLTSWALDQMVMQANSISEGPYQHLISANRSHPTLGL